MAKVSCLNDDVEYIKGTDNQLADWLSRSTTRTDHCKIPLKEDNVINMVKKHEDLGEIPEYEEYHKLLAEIIKGTN